MYTQFFSLKQAPFSIAPDPRYLYMSERHREALAHLLYGVGGGGGFVLLTGEIGAGKTTVCRCFIEQVPDNCKLAYIFNPKLSVAELLLSICDEFGIAVAPGADPASVKRYVDAINGYLLASHARAQNNVLIIDEAQNLSAEVLEQLRLLTNLETNERKLLQIILIGQPELRTMLARPELEQLAQRVIARYHLGSLTQAETASYIQHRLAVAGAQAIAPFPAALMARLQQLTKGVPRRINLLCDRALLGAYVENRPQVTRAILRHAAAEVFVGQGAMAPARSMGWPHVVAGIGAGALLVAALVWALPVRVTPAAAVAVAPAHVASPAVAVPVLAGSSENALRDLASLWGVALPAGAPCDVAASVGLRCQSGKGGLSELSLLDQPAMLRWHDDASHTGYVVLRHADKVGATVRVNGSERSVSLADLAVHWDGDYTTFWHAPREWRDHVGLGARGADVDWLLHQLAALTGAPAPMAGAPMDSAQQTLLRTFQQQQQLQADGVAGPRTFIRLSQLGGGAEPRLLAGAPLAPSVVRK